MRGLIGSIPLLLLFVFCNAQDNSGNPLFNTFKPHAESNSNCAAIVKSAIGTFGVNNVFRYVSTENDKERYIIRLRNGDIVSLSFADLEAAQSICGFSEKAHDLLSADIRKYAIFCFAVMAGELRSQNPAYTYKAAMSRLNNGIELDGAAALLGLRLKPLKPCSVENLSTYNHIIVRNSFYTAYANTGYYDETGDNTGMAALGDFKHNHSGPGCIFGRCNINEAYRIDE